MQVKTAEEIYDEMIGMLPARIAPGPEVTLLLRLVAQQMAETRAELANVVEQMGAPSAEQVAVAVLKKLATENKSND